jgi:hypothetical protein
LGALIAYTDRMGGSDNGVASHKARLKTLGKFGLYWVGPGELVFVFKGEMFHKVVEGPGYRLLVPGLQRIAQRVNIGRDYLNIELRELNTGDGLTIGIDVLLEYLFDPRSIKNSSDLDRFRIVKRVPQQNDRRAVLMMLAQRAMQSVTASYRAETICRGQAWDELERAFFDQVDKRVAPYGIKLERLGCAVQRAYPPEMLKWRFEMAAQRAINIENLGDYAPYQIAQALRSEAIESLKGMHGSSPYFNLNDLAGAEAPPERPAQIVEGTSRPSEAREDIRRNTDAADNTDRKTRRPGKPTGSRLDPDD